MKYRFFNCLFILCIFLISRQVFAERIIAYKGFDRDNVPNLTLFILSLPKLEQIGQKQLPFDVMVRLQQLGTTYNFKAFAPNTEPAFFQLDQNYDIKQADNSVDEKQFTNNRNWKVEVSTSDEVSLIVGDNIYNNIPGLYPISAIIIDQTNNYLYYSANSSTNGINFSKIICYDLNNSATIAEINLNQDESSYSTAERIMNQIHQLYLTSDGKLLATIGTGVLYDDHAHVNE